MTLDWWMVFIWAFWGLLMTLFWWWEYRDRVRQDRAAISKVRKMANLNEVYHKNYRDVHDFLVKSECLVADYRMALKDVAERDQIIEDYMLFDSLDRHNIFGALEDSTS